MAVQWQWNGSGSCELSPDSAPITRVRFLTNLHAYGPLLKHAKNEARSIGKHVLLLASVAREGLGG